MSRSVRYAALGVIGMQAWTAAVAAQAPVPAQPLPVTAAASPAWAVVLDFALDAASGNTSLAVLNTGVRVTHLRTDRAEVEWSAGYSYGESRGTVIERHLATSLKLDLEPQSDLSPFFFAAAEREPVRRIDLQAYGGAGAKYTFWRSARGKASFSSALVYNYETFAARQQRVGAPASGGSTRWSLRARASRKLGAGLQLENTTFFQPVLDRWSDYNLSAVTSATARATTHLSLFLRHTWRRDSTPPDDVEPLDQKLSAGVKLTF